MSVKKYIINTILRSYNVCIFCLLLCCFIIISPILLITYMFTGRDYGTILIKEMADIVAENDKYTHKKNGTQ